MGELQITVSYQGAKKVSLQLAIRTSFSLRVLANQKSFQLATTFLVLPTKTVTWADIRLFFTFWHLLPFLYSPTYPRISLLFDSEL